MAKPPNINAKNQSELRARRRQQGLKRIELWIKPAWESLLKALVENLKSKDSKKE